MNRLPKCLQYGLTAALVVSTAALASADPPAAEMERPSESQFVLFAFEKMMTDGWPEAKLVLDKGQVRVLKVGEVFDGDQFPVVTPENVSAFVAQRERIVHDLVDHVKELNLGDKQQNKDLVEVLELYMKSLHQHGDKLATDLDEGGKDLRQKQIEFLQKVDREAGQKKLEAAYHVMATANFMSQATDDPLTVGFATALVGLAEDARIKREIIYDARKGYLQYLANGGMAEYSKKSQAKAGEALIAFGNDLAEQKEAAKRLAQALADKHKWTDTETPFVADPQAERKTDLFTQLLRINAESLETAKGDSALAESLLARAAKYAKLAALVPLSKNKANNYYRATFYYLAGVDANEAARLTVDTDGFSAAKPCAAARASMKYWMEYKIYNDRDMNGETLHNYCLALAYNGQAVAAFDALKVDSKFFHAQPPEFFYDQARMCSVAAEEFAVQMAKNPAPKFSVQSSEQRARLRWMYEESSLSLYRAVFFGYKDFERAKAVRDLKALREVEPKSDVAPGRSFEQIVGEP